MSLSNDLLAQLKQNPEQINFTDVMAAIGADYDYQPSAFSNGNTQNEAGTNEGSCKLFAFAQIHQLEPQATLALFGDFYRKDVLENPAGDDHANIRNFMQTGWQGIKFDKPALSAKA